MVVVVQRCSAFKFCLPLGNHLSWGNLPKSYAKMIIYGEIIVRKNVSLKNIIQKAKIIIRIFVL